MTLLPSAIRRRLRSSWFGVARQRETSEVCQVLIGLMQDLQFHRGLSGAVLVGQSEFGPELDAIEQKLSRSLHALDEQYGVHHPIFRLPQWQAVLSSWVALQDNWRDLDFYTNLFVHSELIKGLVEVLRILVEEYGQYLGEQRMELLKRWPMLIEQLGILRALGLHWLCHEPAMRDPRVRGSMRDYLGYAGRGLRTTNQQPAGEELLQSTRRALQEVSVMLFDQAEQLPAQQYYAQMTALIDAWYRILSRQVALPG